jgi:8-oxo-dGTP pyrophosphatase MutT (NUDIX family)
MAIVQCKASLSVLKKGLEVTTMLNANSAIVKTETRQLTSVNVYLLLQKEEQILCLLRKNTGYCDGMWGLVSGHVEAGESATEAMVREAWEEVGIEIHPSCIEVAHIMHRQSSRLNVDVFFACSSWNGNLHNREPEKCERLEFFPRIDLPKNTIDYVSDAIGAVKSGKFYSEKGW